MGLAISVGVLADLIKNDAEGAASMRKQLARVNALLKAKKLPEHHEPESLPKIALPAHVSSFPYSFSHYLRRAFAHARNLDDGELVEPVKKGADPTKDPLLDDEYTLYMDSHLCCHSDAEGFYVPIDMDVLYGDNKHDVAGGMVGSSQRLLAELRALAPHIGIASANPSAAELARIHAESSSEKVPLWHEQMVWLTLFVKAKASVEHKTAIVFH